MTDIKGVQFTKSVLTKSIGRRDAAKLLGIGGGALAAGGLWLPGGVQAATEPKKGGHLRVAGPASDAGDTLDPTKLHTLTDGIRNNQIYSRLLRYLPGKGFVPQLATSWESSDDFKTWYFNIRKGVEFHNGKTLDAEDVAVSLRRLADPSSSWTKALNAVFSTAKADGPHKVIVELKNGFSDFPALLSTYAYVIWMAEAKEFPKDAIGTGPYVLKEFEPGITSVFERNPNYWVDNRPYIDSIEIFGIGENVARANALQANDADIAAQLEPTLVPQIENDPNLVISEIPSLTFVNWPFRTDTAPFDDVNVRKAFSLGIDRQRMIDIAMSGHGGIGRDHPVHESLSDFCDAIPVPEYDPDQAVSLLKKAGMNNATFELQTSDAVRGGVNTSTVFGELLRENGINVSIKRMPADGYWSTVWRKAPFSASGWSGRPAASLLLSDMFLSTSGSNESYFSNQSFDDALNKATSTKDPDERQENFCKCQKILADEVPTVLPAFISILDAHHKKVKNFTPHPFVAAGDFYWEEIWIDDQA